MYSNEKVGPQGELEQMNDEEYAAYVRQKMWEKTNAGILEERAKREEVRKKKEQEAKHNRFLQEEMERSLRNGEERRLKKKWEEMWRVYTEKWDHWDGSVQGMAWPVEDGRRADVDEKKVKTFFVKGLGLEDIGEKIFTAKLREERVRWHPDKIQQRLGGEVDREVMKDVTAIFQIIDSLWADMKPKAS